MRRRRPPADVRYPRDDATEQRVAEVADEVIRRYGLAEERRRWSAVAMEAGELPAGTPVLALDDYSEIPFLRDIVGVTWYQYRARLRCGEGDWYAVARPAIEGYEEYNQEYLGLGRTELLRVEQSSPGDLALARSVRRDGVAFERLCAVAREGGGLLLHPYMGIQGVWELAAALQQASGVPVRVLAPLPAVTRTANDKARFSEIVERLLGAEALASTATGDEPQLIAERFHEEVHRSAAVALKMPSCASGMGNRIYESSHLRGKPIPEFRALVDRFLDEKEWDGQEPVLVVEWHRHVLESPSTQCWIPPEGAGEPVVEEVFQQFLLGDEQVFEGAMLSSLPRRLRHDFMIRSWLLSRVFQKLGYVGRCSFDALVVGPSLTEGSVKLVECNGRWGGTSTPMHLMKRVFGDFRRLPYKAQDYVDERLRGLDFGQLMEVFGPTLYDRRTGRGRVLLYNVGGVTEHGKFDLLVTGRSYADVQRFISDRIPRLVSRYLRKPTRSAARS
jgi:hypothetical protein